MERSYSQLTKIPFKPIRFPNDHFYPIWNPTVIRRNYSYRYNNSTKIIIRFTTSSALIKTSYQTFTSKNNKN